jgi:hypothetical protein
LYASVFLPADLIFDLNHHSGPLRLSNGAYCSATYVLLGLR